MSIRKIIVISLLSLVFLSLTLGLRMNVSALLLLDLPLCLIIIFACTNNFYAWVITSLVSGIFFDAVASASVPIHTILYLITGYALMQLMKTRLAQRSSLAVIFSSLIGTVITFIAIGAMFLLSVTQWPSELILLGFQQIFLSSIISIGLHMLISVFGISILKYNPPEFRLRPYKARV